jgi:hypothetical protein
VTSINIVALAQLKANAFKPTLHVKARNSAGLAKRDGPISLGVCRGDPGDFEPDDRQAEADCLRRALSYLAPDDDLHAVCEVAE